MFEEKWNCLSSTLKHYEAKAFFNHLDVHEDERGSDVRVDGTESAGDRSRVDVEVALVLVSLELVRLAADQDVAVQLSVQRGQSWKTKCMTGYKISWIYIETFEKSTLTPQKKFTYQK